MQRQPTQLPCQCLISRQLQLQLLLPQRLLLARGRNCAATPAAVVPAPLLGLLRCGGWAGLPGAIAAHAACIAVGRGIACACAVPLIGGATMLAAASTIVAGCLLGPHSRLLPRMLLVLLVLPGRRARCGVGLLLQAGTWIQ